MFSEHYQEFYAHVLDTLDEKTFPIPVQVIMAIGKGQSMANFGLIPGNLIVVPFAPQIKLIERACFVVTHGIVNFINETFMYGKPMLIVHLGGDRMEFAQRVAYQGAGITLDVERTSPGWIRASVLELLRQPRYTRASEGVMKSYRPSGGAVTAAVLISRLAETRQPAVRKQWLPVTLYSISDLPDYVV